MRIKIIFSIAVLCLFLLGCTESPESVDDVPSEDETLTQEIITDLGSAMESNEERYCTGKDIDNKDIRIWLKNGNVRSETERTASPRRGLPVQEITFFALYVDNTIYSWSSTEKIGFKFDTGNLEGVDITPKRDLKDHVTEVECIAIEIEDSMFEPPEDVNFGDF